MTDHPDRPAAKPAAFRVDRRMFLRGAGVAAVAAPAAAVAAEKLAKPTEHRLAARYKDSDHVQRFYALNRR